ncbi:MAG: branched-chain amino acid transaminase [Anaerolineales bacterium]|nr:branched-chain amino acid transaminase [Anaerolineales bacterium]
MGMESKYIWKNGELVPFEQATVHFLTPALHYGAAVFEGIRAYNTPKGPAIFRLHEHVERLFASARVLGFRDFPWSFDDVMKGHRDTVRENGFADCYIRPLIFLDGGGWNLNVDYGKPSLMIAVWEWNNYLGDDALAKGIRANISTYTRHHVNISMTKAKISGNYANSILAKTESERNGFQEAIMLDAQGYVAECTGENLFVVRDGVIYTPSTAPVLEGITRSSLYTIAKDLGYEVKEVPISRDQLYIADEVFVCGTAAEVIGLSEIDYRKIGDGRTGPITRKLQEVFHDAIRGKVAKYESWCDYVA